MKVQAGRLLILTFVGALLAPWADHLLRPASARDPEQHENRRAAALPPPPADLAALAVWPRQAERWLADRLGWRDQLLRANSLQSLEIFGVHPAPDLILGQQDWWFYSGDRAREILERQERFTSEELERWAGALERMQRFCEQESIVFAVAFGPNKETIYPEHLPRRLQGLRAPRLDALQDELKRRGVLCIDLRPALLAAKAQDSGDDTVYHRLGTHWSERGGFVAARTMVAALALPGTRPLQETDYERALSEGQGDSASALYYVERDWRQQAWHWRPRAGYRSVDRVVQAEPYPVRVREQPEAASGPRLMLAHDSFGMPVDQYLAEAFPSLVQNHRYAIDRGLVRAWQPQVLVALFVERHLGAAPWALLGGWTQAEARARFERSPERLYRWDGTRAAFATRRQAGIRADPQGGLRFTAPTGADLLLLPTLPYPAEGGATLRLVVDSPEAHTADLFYLRSGASDYERSANLELELDAGRSERFLVLDEPGLKGRLALRLRSVRSLRVLELELAAAPP
jgi:hypothetical protein